MANIIKDESGFKVTIDRSEGQRYSILGPLEDDEYSVTDHEEGESLGRFANRELAIEFVGTLGGDETSAPGNS